MLARALEHRPTIDTAEPWFIVASEPRREKVAEHSLIREQFQVYCPIVQVYVKPRRNRMSHSQRRRNCIIREKQPRPAFPGYLFVRIAGARGLGRVFELTGVRGIVHFGEQLAKMPARLVEKMKTEIEGGILDEHQAVTPFRFAVDETVRISDGVFTGFNAKIERIDESRELIHVLTTFLGQASKIALSLDQVEKL